MPEYRVPLRYSLPLLTENLKQSGLGTGHHLLTVENDCAGKKSYAEEATEAPRVVLASSLMKPIARTAEDCCKSDRNMERYVILFIICYCCYRRDSRPIYKGELVARIIVNLRRFTIIHELYGSGTRSVCRIAGSAISCDYSGELPQWSKVYPLGGEGSGSDCGQMTIPVWRNRYAPT